MPQNYDLNNCYKINKLDLFPIIIIFTGALDLEKLQNHVSQNFEFKGVNTKHFQRRKHVT